MDDTESRLREALEEIIENIRLRNDLEAYFYAIAEWGLGWSNTKPKKEDYGIDGNQNL